MVFQRQQIIPGFLEIYCGCMKSGKTRALIDRIDGIHFREDASYKFFKPTTDTRNGTVQSRFGNLEFECEYIDPSNPYKIIPNSQDCNVVAIDEIMFFDDSLIDAIKELTASNKMVLGSGLDLDFRGEPFGIMPNLIALADYVSKSHGTCEYNGCSQLANRSQRLINGEPANYNSPLESVENSGASETYECRCQNHHYVPGRP